MNDTTTFMEQTTLTEMRTDRGRSVAEVSYGQPVLLVFLRRFGCTFCREAMTDLARKKAHYEQSGVHLIFVHMSDAEEATHNFREFKLEGSEHVCDPECHFYTAFGLRKGTVSQLFGLQVMLRGLDAGIRKGHGLGAFTGDGFQMPGVFLIHNGAIREKFIHKLASDRPDYDQIVACCMVP